MSLARWLAAAAILLALYFAIQGGEYGTTHLLELRQDVAREQEQVTQLEVVVDSLERMARAIQHDRRMQERVARESFGMIRKGEHLFRIVPGDSVTPLE
ncbi:MAG TPA: septum formation initiator family protein [Gemmatimonadales bacterium]